MGKIQKILNIILAPFIVIFAGVLGALGGADNSSKSYRRILLPLILAGYSWSRLDNWLAFSILALSGVLSIGYGVPDAGDEGSGLGRIIAKLLKYDPNCHGAYQELAVNMIVRGVIGLLSCACLVIIPILMCNWITYLVATALIVAVYSTISWRDLGRYKLFNRNLLWSETLTYSTLALGAVLLLYVRL